MHAVSIHLGTSPCPLSYCLHHTTHSALLPCARPQVQRWTYTPRTRTIRAAARIARDAGVRVRELKADELTPEMRRRLQEEVSGDA
jgi:hypothetical protein